MRIQIQVVTWNSAKELPALLASIETQTRKPDAVLAIDNNSTDGTKEILQNKGITCIEQKTNTGFSYAHNIGIASSDADAILCVNPDLELMDTALERLEEALASDKKIGSVSGILIKTPLTDSKKISIVDSAGIKRNAFFGFSNIGENSPLDKQYQKKRQVVANTGACVLIHKQRASTVSVKKEDRFEIFDEDIFAYKDDIDLGLRLHKGGFTNVVIGEIVAHHSRHIGSQLNHAARSKKQIFLSYRNHILVLVKNVSLSELLFFGILIIPYELAKLLFLFLTHPLTTIKALLSAIWLTPRMLRKRSWINR